MNAQERTKQELLDALAEALREALEMNRLDALSHANDDYEEVVIAP